MNRTIAVLALLLLAPLVLEAQGILAPVVGGNELRAGISLPGGLTADLTISFEQVVGLTPENLGLAASVVNPLDPDLLARLEGAAIPAGFPVLVRIEPPGSGGLSFGGVVSIAMHTHLLSYVPNTPLRLFAASAGGPFEDITVEMGSGSYRCRGRKGGFSEFLIVADLRPLEAVIEHKLDRLDQILADHATAMPLPLLDELTDRLEAAREAFEVGDTAGAIAQVDAFLAAVRSHTGTAIPDVWRATRDLPNVAGLLRAGGETLRFSLSLEGRRGVLGLV